MEGAGVVVAVGDGVSEVHPVTGAYASAPRRGPMPKTPDPRPSAGQAARFHRPTPCGGHDAAGDDRPVPAASHLPGGPGDPILFHAAAGGVGLIACQWARYLGATVIGTVGRSEGRACQGPRLPSPYPLSGGGFRRPDQGIDWRRGRSGGLRFGRPGHLSEIPRLPAADGDAGHLRPGFGTGRPFDPACSPPRARCFLPGPP